MPEPLAYQELVRERSVFGRAKAFARELRRLLGGRPDERHAVERSHAAEVRHADWAPAMEAIMRRRFSDEELEGLGLVGLQLVSHDCRTSTCRLEIEWPVTLERAQAEGEKQRSPLARLIRSRGPLATGDSSHSDPGRVQIGDRVRVRMLLFFGPEAIDPNRYAAWVTAAVSRPPPAARTH